MSPTRPCPGPTPGTPCPTRATVPTRLGSKQATRCATCRAAWQHAKDQRRPERRTSAAITRNQQAIAEWVSAYGYVCPGVARLSHAPHTANPRTNPLTAEHINAFALTHDEHGPLMVLCRSINSALGARLASRPLG